MSNFRRVSEWGEACAPTPIHVLRVLRASERASERGRAGEQAAPDALQLQLQLSPARLSGTRSLTFLPTPACLVILGEAGMGCDGLMAAKGEMDESW